jgi:type IV pilus assembly protein PilQ
MKHLVFALLFCACAAQSKKPRIDLDLREASLHDAFRAIGHAAHVNFDLDPEVAGNVTVVVRAQPWDAVVARIAREHHLRIEEVRGIVYVSDAARPARERPRFSGARITVAFDETPIREAMAELARAANQTIVVADDVEMRVTMRVRDVPWDLALEHLTRKEGLRVVREARVLRIVHGEEPAGTR